MPNSKRPITILMADDDADDRQMTKEAFDEARLANDLRFVEDGVELLDYLHRRGKYADPADSPRPSIILLDLNMPRVSGLDAIPALHSVSPNAKIIVITGKTGHELAARTLKSGAIDFLSKPLDYEALGRSLTIARAITYPNA